MAFTLHAVPPSGACRECSSIRDTSSQKSPRLQVTGIIPDSPDKAGYNMANNTIVS